VAAAARQQGVLVERTCPGTAGRDRETVGGGGAGGAISLGVAAGRGLGPSAPGTMAMAARPMSSAAGRLAMAVP
jgi:hypothetical protein